MTHTQPSTRVTRSFVMIKSVGCINDSHGIFSSSDKMSLAQSRPITKTIKRHGADSRKHRVSSRCIFVYVLL